MATRILRVTARDIRFPTSRTLDGSDAMNPDPDYSAAYVVLETDHPAGLAGHGLTFTIGRGTELCVAAVELLAGHVVGTTLEAIASDMAGFWRGLVADSQLRWLGPEKGVVHLAKIGRQRGRLRLARNFLREDGVVCVSIDDCERDNLRKVCDEICEAGKGHRRNDRIHAVLRYGRAADKCFHGHGLRPPEGMDALFPLMGRRGRSGSIARFYCHCKRSIVL